MNDEELKQLWRQQNWQPASQTSGEELVAQMKAKMRKFDRDIFWRDIRELTACGVILCFFGLRLFQYGSLLSHVGCAVLVLSAIVIGLVLVITQRLHSRHRNLISVKEFTSAEWSKVNSQIKLLKSVLWWYILPIYVGVELFIFGLQAETDFKITFTIAYAVVCASIYWVNQYAIRKRLAPLADELDQHLRTIPSSEDLGDTPKEN